MRFSRFGRASWDPTDCEASACESLLSRAEPSPPPWTRTYKDVDGPKTALSLRPHYQRRAPSLPSRSGGAYTPCMPLLCARWAHRFTFLVFGSDIGMVDGMDAEAWTDWIEDLGLCRSLVHYRDVLLPSSRLPSPPPLSPHLERARGLSSRPCIINIIRLQSAVVRICIPHRFP